MNDNGSMKATKANIIKRELKAASAAFHFLTIIPPIRQIPYSSEDLGKSIAYYPLIGFFIGPLLWGMYHLLGFVFALPVTAALLIALWIGISGALHFDGFLDTCDGILGGANAEERLAIMKDERVGAFGLVGGTLLVLIKYSALISLDGLIDQALLIAPLVSRWGMALVIVGFPYGRNAGLGLTIKQFADWKRVIIGLFITVTLVWFISGVNGIFIFTGATLIIWLTAKYISRKIPGLTGDSYGAINEIAEALVLIGFTMVLKFV